MKDLLENHVNTDTLPFHSSMRSIELVVSTVTPKQTIWTMKIVKKKKLKTKLRNKKEDDFPKLIFDFVH